MLDYLSPDMVDPRRWDKFWIESGDLCVLGVLMYEFLGGEASLRIYMLLLDAKSDHEGGFDPSVVSQLTKCLIKRVSNTIFILKASIPYRTDIN
jgi:hypothetical protein